MSKIRAERNEQIERSLVIRYRARLVGVLAIIFLIAAIFEGYGIYQDLAEQNRVIGTLIRASGLRYGDILVVLDSDEVVYATIPPDVAIVPGRRISLVVSEGRPFDQAGYVFERYLEAQDDR